MDTSPDHMTRNTETTPVTDQAVACALERMDDWMQFQSDFHRGDSQQVEAAAWRLGQFVQRLSASEAMSRTFLGMVELGEDAVWNYVLGDIKRRRPEMETFYDHEQRKYSDDITYKGHHAVAAKDAHKSAFVTDQVDAADALAERRDGGHQDIKPDPDSTIPQQPLPDNEAAIVLAAETVVELIAEYQLTPEQLEAIGEDINVLLDAGFPMDTFVRKVRHILEGAEVAYEANLPDDGYEDLDPAMRSLVRTRNLVQQFFPNPVDSDDRMNDVMDWWEKHDFPVCAIDRCTDYVFPMAKETGRWTGGLGPKYCTRHDRSTKANRNRS